MKSKYKPIKLTGNSYAVLALLEQFGESTSYDIKQAIEEPTEVGEAAAPPVADRETREPPGELKDIKPLSTDRQMKDVKEPKETRELEEAKELKEKKAPTPAKETKASKARSGDADSTLPPSLD